jgi:hypothetical protein
MNAVQKKKVSVPDIEHQFLSCRDQNRVSIPPEMYTNCLPTVHDAIIQTQTGSGAVFWDRSLYKGCNLIYLHVPNLVLQLTCSVNPQRYLLFAVFDPKHVNGGMKNSFPGELNSNRSLR